MRRTHGRSGFAVLGPVIAWRCGTDLPLGGPKQRAVLATLLLARENVVSVDRIVDAVWGEDPPARAVQTVQVCVSKLRRAVTGAEEGGAAITHVRPGYRLRLGAAELDLSHFEAHVEQAHRCASNAPGTAIAELRHALDLWRGEALADIAHLPGPSLTAVRLREMRANAMEEYLEMRLHHDDVEDLVGELRAAVEDEPLRERRWTQLVSALWRLGRRCDALRACADLRVLLGDEFGIEPCTEILTLEHRIRTETSPPTMPIPLLPHEVAAVSGARPA